MNFNDSVDLIKNDLVRITQDLVRIKSVQDNPIPGGPFGKGVKDCLEKTLEICSSMGFRTRNVDGYAGYAEWGEGDELIGILVHLDVVPEGSDWSYPPFSGEIVDGKIYGRGTSDNKAPTVSVIHALNILKNSGIKFNKRVRIIFGCNEESGWECIEHYIKKEEIPGYGFTPDGLFPIINSEKGIMKVELSSTFNENNKEDLFKIIRLNGGTASNMVPDYCECKCEYKPELKDVIYSVIEKNKQNKDLNIQMDDRSNRLIIKSKGIAVASSVPEEGKNAIIHLFYILNEMTAGISSSQIEFIRYIIKNIGEEVNGENIGIKMQDDVSGPLTLNLGIADFDQNNGKIILDIRYPVKRTENEIFQLLKNNIQSTKITIEKGKGKKPLFVPDNHFLVGILGKVYEEQTGNKAELISIGGGTYARAFDNFVAFGALFPGREMLAHRKDEYIFIEDLIKMTKIYTFAMKELLEYNN